MQPTIQAPGSCFREKRLRNGMRDVVNAVEHCSKKQRLNGVQDIVPAHRGVSQLPKDGEVLAARRCRSRCCQRDQLTDSPLSARTRWSRVYLEASIHIPNATAASEGS